MLLFCNLGFFKNVYCTLIHSEKLFISFVVLYTHNHWLALSCCCYCSLILLGVLLFYTTKIQTQTHTRTPTKKLDKVQKIKFMWVCMQCNSRSSMKSIYYIIVRVIFVENIKSMKCKHECFWTFKTEANQIHAYVQSESGICVIWYGA